MAKRNVFPEDLVFAGAVRCTGKISSRPAARQHVKKCKDCEEWIREMVAAQQKSIGRSKSSDFTVFTNPSSDSWTPG